MLYPAVFTFDIPTFRTDFPEFSNDVSFPDATLQLFWDNAICYISANNCGYLNDASRLQALNLMTAHLTKLSTLIAMNQVPGLVQSAGVDKINVSLTPPPLSNQWQWWLSVTAYGQQLFALLQVTAVGGFSVGGLPETSAFRKVYGIFE